MEQENVEEDRRLQIKKLREKVKSLVSGVEFFDVEDDLTFTSKLQHESVKASVQNDSKSSDDIKTDESEEEFLDCSECDFSDDTSWLLSVGSGSKSLTDVCKLVYGDIDDRQPDIKDIFLELQVLKKWSSSSLDSCSSSDGSSSISNSTYIQRNLIDSRTFTRPKKCMSRTSTNSLTSTDEESGKVRLQRRLTTTITPSPNLISKLEELSKVNNRPLSGNYSDTNWEEGSEGLAELEKSKRKSIPASLLDRLQELKKSNNSFVIPKIETFTSSINSQIEDRNSELFLQDAKLLTSGFDLNARNSSSTSRLSEIFKNTPEYFSDDNESFISLDEVSSFCDRLTLSTDQSTYSTIVKEMEEHEICLFHRKTISDQPENRLTFGGKEIPSQLLLEDLSASDKKLNDSDLNITYELVNDAEEKRNLTFEIQKNESLSKLNALNTTYDKEPIKPGIVDVIMQSNIINNLSPNFDFANHNHSSLFEKKEVLNETYDKLNGTYNKNEIINGFNNEKYSSKIFDATFKKPSPAKMQNESSPPEKNNVKKDSDHSEDDCMSTTSDNSYRSVESNTEVKNIEELKNIALQQNKKLSDVKFSTPKAEGNRIVTNRNSEEWRTFSPIKHDPEDCGSQDSSNASSRGPSPRTVPVHGNIGSEKSRPSIRQPLKVPQKELKLKAPFIRPTQNFKKPVNQPMRPVSEPLVPTRVDCGPTPAPCVPVMRPSPMATVPSQPNLRPTSRASGIPRPPSRLKQPQIRVFEGTKK